MKALTVAAALTGALMLSAPARAAPLTGGAGSQLPQASRLPLEPAQIFLYEGRRYCFYDDGWRGPGFYWCGYAFRRGYGWGGPRGWRGWDGPRHRDFRGPPRRDFGGPPDRGPRGNWQGPPPGKGPTKNNPSGKKGAPDQPPK